MGRPSFTEWALSAKLTESKRTKLSKDPDSFSSFFSFFFFLQSTQQNFHCIFCVFTLYRSPERKLRGSRDHVSSSFSLYTQPLTSCLKQLHKLNNEWMNEWMISEWMGLWDIKSSKFQRMYVFEIPHRASCPKDPIWVSRKLWTRRMEWYLISLSQSNLSTHPFQTTCSSEKLLKYTKL